MSKMCALKISDKYGWENFQVNFIQINILGFRSKKFNEVEYQQLPQGNEQQCPSDTSNSYSVGTYNILFTRIIFKENNGNFLANNRNLFC